MKYQITIQDKNGKVLKPGTRVRITDWVDAIHSQKSYQDVTIIETPPEKSGLWGEAKDEDGQLFQSPIIVCHDFDILELEVLEDE